MLPASVHEFRARYRAEEIGPRYHGIAHLLLTSVASLAAVAYAASRLQDVAPATWMTVPMTFLFANLAEYLGHRGPMHNLRPGLALVYKRHTRQHHHFFTREAMPAESPRDFKMVLFPPVLLLFFLGGIMIPAGLLLRLLVSSNVALLFVATAAAYFVTYEWLHLCYHLPPDSLVGRLPGMAALRQHHTLHHDLALMNRYNFNITFPISDVLFGTRYQGEPRHRPPSGWL